MDNRDLQTAGLVLVLASALLGWSKDRSWKGAAKVAIPLLSVLLATPYGKRVVRSRR